MTSYNVSTKKVGDTSWTLFKPVRGKHRSIAQAKLLARPQAGITARVTTRDGGDVLFQSEEPHVEHVCTKDHALPEPDTAFPFHVCDSCGIEWDIIDPDDYLRNLTPCTMGMLPW